MSKLSTKELCEQLWHLEKEEKLFNQKIQGIYFWETVRFAVFNNLSRQLVDIGQAHTKRNSWQDKLVAVAGLIINSITKNPFHGKYKVDFLLFDHPRKINVDGKEIDIYTYEFIEANKHRKFDIIEAPYLWRHKTSNVRLNRKYSDNEILQRNLKKNVNPLKIDNNERTRIIQLENKIIKKFGNVKVNLLNITLKTLNNFYYKVNYYKRLFIKRKPKSIYVVVSYTNIPIIAAAKGLGIKVIEFQHGVISDYHFAYNFGEPTKQLQYFPDKLLTFGEYWGKTKGFPKQTEIEVYGFPYLNRQLSLYGEYQKNKKQILILSQGTIGKELSKKVKKLIKHMPDYQFIYKLHPGEYDRWRTEYPDLVEASKYKNLDIIDNNNENLYSLLAKSEFQIGVNSTALFEGLALNCKTIIFSLPGFEYMDDLIKRDIIKIVDDYQEAINCIKDYTITKFPKKYFFK